MLPSPRNALESKKREPSDDAADDDVHRLKILPRQGEDHPMKVRDGMTPQREDLGVFILRQRRSDVATALLMEIEDRH